jgi:hypothetical protein
MIAKEAGEMFNWKGVPYIKAFAGRHTDHQHRCFMIREVRELAEERNGPILTHRAGNSNREGSIARTHR